MNNKEYGVKLDVDITKFTKKLTDAQTYTNAVMKQIKDSIKEPLEEAGDTAKSAFEKKIGVISKLGKQLGTLTMQYANVVLTEGENSESAVNLKQQIRELNTEMEKEGDELSAVGDALGRLYEDEANANNETKKLNINLGNLFNRAKQGTSSLEKTIDSSLKKGITSIKRFSLSLLGIQSAYSMISKAVHSYMAYDTQMSTKIQANWVALGAMFAPIVEKLIGLFQKLVAYVNVFWKAFTGKNLIDIALKKVQKTASATTKAVKSLNKELANVDEITNLNFDQGGGDIDTGAGGEYGIEDALNEIKNLQLNPKLVETMTWLGEKFKDFVKWCENIKKKFDEMGIGLDDILIQAGALYGAFKFTEIMSWIGKIIGVEGGATGIFGMKTALGFVCAYLIGVFLLKMQEAYYTIEKMHEGEHELGQTRLNSIRNAKANIEKYNALLDAGIKTDENGVDLKEKINQEIQRAQTDYEMFNNDIKDGIDYTKEEREEMWGLKTDIENITNEKWETNVDVRITPVPDKRGWNDFANNFVDYVDKLLPDFMRSSRYREESKGGVGRHLAKGNVAYEPTYAEFGEYAGARSNPEITAPQNMIRQTLSEALVEAIPQIRGGSGDTILYVNGRELARTTYQDFKNEGSRLGSSNVAIRRG